MAKLNPLRWGEGKRAKAVQKIVDQVTVLEDDYAKLSDGELQAKTDEFRARLEAGQTLEDILPEAYATVREASWRVLRQKPYEVQIFGGIALHQGNIAEMRTGEGKTLTSTMPVYLNALEGKGVHVITVNEYLAGRDAEWMGRVHTWLGLTIGLVHSQQSKESKRESYNCDITYGTTNEFGFDYLRDNMAWEKRLQVQQRGHNYALVDEVDSILVDEARTPLIISGPAEQSAQLYEVFSRRVVPNLKKGEEIVKPGGYRETTGDYVVDEGKRTVGVTEEGVEKVEKLLGIENLYESVNTPLIHHLNNAIKAKELFKRDKEYIVAGGEVKIVDESTGRVLEGRRYSEGLHQAIEAKEGVKIKEENQTLATITLQNYYRGYDKLAGMTGTAKTEEIEFLEIYELGVVEVPTHREIVRFDKSDLIYKTEKAKFEAVVEDIVERHEKGQPVLVGTTSVEKSELVARLLKQRGIKHNVLNAKFHEREAHIVAQAGQPGAVTVSTNMAGRGTDILLGGNPEELAKDDVSKLPAEATDEEKTAAYEVALAKYSANIEADKQKVLEAGGLYVIGTERHESRRVDNQLRGRSGRQGDPGESRFYLSLQDDLMRLFNASAVESIMTRLQIPDDVPIEHKMVTRAVANAQRQVESRNFDIRKNVLKYDDVMNEQRKVVYGQRQKLIDGDADTIGDLAQKYVDEAIEDALDLYAPEGVFPEDWDLEQLEAHVKRIYDCEYDFASIDLEEVSREQLHDDLIDDVDTAFEAREQEVGGEKVMREVERRVLLSVMDRKWREHLYEMDALRDGIGLRAVGQRDPLTEYQREAYDSFVAMMHGIKEESVTYFFRLPVNQEGQQGQQAQPGAQGQSQGAPAQPQGGPAVNPASIVGGAPRAVPRMGQAAGRPQGPAAATPAASAAGQAPTPAQPAARPATPPAGAQPQVTFSQGQGGATPPKPGQSYSFGLASGSGTAPTAKDAPAAPAAPPTDPSPAAPATPPSTPPVDASPPAAATPPAPPVEAAPPAAATPPTTPAAATPPATPAAPETPATPDGAATPAVPEADARLPSPAPAPLGRRPDHVKDEPAPPVRADVGKRPDAPSAPGNATAAPAPTAPTAPEQEARPDVGIDPNTPQRLSYNQPTAGGPSAPAADVSRREDGTHVRRVAAGEMHVKEGEWDTVGRNDPCPCGSERKYKKCHGAPGA